MYDFAKPSGEMYDFAKPSGSTHAMCLRAQSSSACMDPNAQEMDMRQEPAPRIPKQRAALIGLQGESR
ncbi:predicted protein [Chaetomium globosum CBS 148.51]|uniref:Uncharacterized protein n=1 Tax=Chaetomium globosum (strain ATCC 6205 / CBS 148.51 / DSM 1962 / NBRC 6347 / NRRL 1970) TaxID=306901 RepID=Q2HB47_CHAGB|nr:uncharacterized protein CHGG_02557 [Chaetomium globosum CBS 148.51]EAQ90622.1 predicted protein [Chaetomium globosum CBS 148.51]